MNLEVMKAGLPAAVIQLKQRLKRTLSNILGYD